MTLDVKLLRLIERHEKIAAMMSQQDDLSSDDIVRLSKEYAELTPIVETITELQSVTTEIADLDSLIEGFVERDGQVLRLALAGAGDRNDEARLANCEKAGAALAAKMTRGTLPRCFVGDHLSMTWGRTAAQYRVHRQW